MNSKINAKYKCYFQEIWPDDPKFSSWSRKDESETQAFCLLCLQSFSVESHGKTSLTLHASREKHKSRMPNNTKSTLVTFVPASKSKGNKTDDLKESEQSSSGSVKDYFTSQALAAEEILWVLTNKYSLNSCRDKNELFSKMFKDSRIAQSFTVSSTKCSYMISFGLALYFKSFMEESLKESPYYVFCFDESHNSSIKKGQMDFHVRFWENATDTVSTRYYNSELLQKTAAVDVHQKSEPCSKGLDVNKMIQIFL